MQPTPEMIEAHARQCWDRRFPPQILKPGPLWDEAVASDDPIMQEGVALFRQEAKDALTAALAVMPAPVVPEGLVQGDMPSVGGMIVVPAGGSLTLRPRERLALAVIEANGDAAAPQPAKEG